MGRVLAIEPGMEQAVSELGRSGFRVRSVAESHVALALALKETFDVALLDVTMPEMAGLSLVCRLREHAPNMRIVVLMAMHTNELAAQAAEAGVFQMLQKPADPNSLLRVMRAAVLDRQHFMSSLAGHRATPTAVTGHVDQMVSRMRTPPARAAARSLFDATPEELGEAAVTAARLRD